MAELKFSGSLAQCQPRVSLEVNLLGKVTSTASGKCRDVLTLGSAGEGLPEDDTEQPDYIPAHSLPPKDSIPPDNEPGEALPRLTSAFVKCLSGSNIINGSQEEHEIYC